jgi:hypothetical protein
MIIDPDDKIAEKRQPDEAGNVAISHTSRLAIAASDVAWAEMSSSNHR